MSVVTGNVRTDQILAAKIPVDMRAQIDLWDEQPAFFEHLSRQFKGGVESVENMKTQFLEMQMYPMVLSVQEVENAGETALAVDHPEYAHRDQVIFNARTGELYLMNEDVGGGTAAGKITVVNHATGTGGITSATAVGDILLIGPEAHAEGEAIPPAYSQKVVEHYTYLFQHDRSRANTDIQREQKEYGPKQLLLDRKLFWLEEMKRLAIILYVGSEVRETTSAGGPRRHMMQGLEKWIKSNNINFANVSGDLSLQAVGEILRKTKIHSASSETKIGICGQNSWVSVSALPENQIRTTVSESSWGKRLKTLVTPFGNLAIGYDNLLSAEHGLADRFFVLDPAYIDRLQHKGLPTKLLLNVENSEDIHNQKDVITGTDGLRVRVEALHARGYNIN